MGSVKSVIVAAVVASALAALSCGADDGDLTGRELAPGVELWGHFLLVNEGTRQPPLAELDLDLPDPPAASEYPELSEGDPTQHPWARRFFDVERAQRELPPGTYLPIPSEQPDGYDLFEIIALVHPETQEVYWVQVWYGSVARRPFHLADLLILYTRLSGGPLPGEVLAEPRPLDPAAPSRGTQLPLIKARVAGRPGVYLGFDFMSDAEQLGRNILDALQWTAPDGTYWTIQGVLPLPDLIELAEDIYRPVVFQAHGSG